MQSDDQLLLDKVVNDAGLRNDLVLSLGESIRAKVLLGNAERGLVAIDKDIAHLTRRQVHAKHVEKFRVAVAPIKRVPVELLTEIFAHFIPDAGEFYDPTPVPWFLGQVCALWRRVSHGNSELWSVMLDDSMSSIRLCEILPPAANTHLSMAVINSNMVLSLIPILHHVKLLWLNMDLREFDQLWRTVRPESFARLESFTLVIRQEIDIGRPDWYSSPFLYDSSRWTEHTPFRLARNLQSLTIDCRNYSLQLGLLVLGMGFPINQISLLDLSHIPGHGLPITIVTPLIKKCATLKTLRIKLPAGVDLDAGDKYPLLLDAFHGLQGLHSLTLVESDSYNFDRRPVAAANYSAYLVLMAMHSGAWARLSVLNIFQIVTDGSLLRQCLAQCEQLTELSACVTPLTSVFDTIHRDITLPHLQLLTMHRIEHMWMFQSLLTPALCALYIEFAHEYCLDVAAVCEMITSSGCSILDFGCSSSLTSPDYIGLPNLHKVFTVVPGVRHIRIRHIYLDTEVYAELVQGGILPCVETLVWSMESLHQFIQLIEGRAEWELRTHGRVVIKEYQNLSVRSYGDSEVEKTLRDLREKYRIKITVR
ncbi:hypothetical protein DXG03_002112 [Asterophora parasitica]|uniref:F-box domain-containing protein n=1 Tax=Asterophora parasitica TaxID=117018 RepID=A0A9P7G387_9AGAR|nr:hypothetical protein DXG03_002112 [Asterophora parasitica]